MRSSRGARGRQRATIHGWQTRWSGSPRRRRLRTTSPSLPRIRSERPLRDMRLQRPRRRRSADGSQRPCTRRAVSPRSQPTDDAGCCADGPGPSAAPRRRSPPPHRLRERLRAGSRSGRRRHGAHRASPRAWRGWRCPADCSTAWCPALWLGWRSCWRSPSRSPRGSCIATHLRCWWPPVWRPSSSACGSRHRACWSRSSCRRWPAWSSRHWAWVCSGVLVCSAGVCAIGAAPECPLGCRGRGLLPPRRRGDDRGRVRGRLVGRGTCAPSARPGPAAASPNATGCGCCRSVATTLDRHPSVPPHAWLCRHGAGGVDRRRGASHAPRTRRRFWQRHAGVRGADTRPRAPIGAVARVDWRAGRRRRHCMRSAASASWSVSHLSSALLTPPAAGHRAPVQRPSTRPSGPRSCGAYFAVDQAGRDVAAAAHHRDGDDHRRNAACPRCRGRDDAAGRRV